MPVVLLPEQVETWRCELPEPPSARRKRLVEEYELPDYDAGVLVADREIADFFEASARSSSNPKSVANWIMTEMLRLLSERNTDVGRMALTPEALAGLVGLVDGKVINSTIAKEVFAVLFERGGDPARIVEEKGLTQVSDTGSIEALVDRAMRENPKSVADFRAGRQQAAKFLVGQVMRLSRGKADPRMVADILEERLAQGA
ncbi:Asp-tRNA(Asn)/Glu-tRNA(Gln) amidotransferase GatCAB subunit B, partial [Verrucomicrobiota bacterium]